MINAAIKGNKNNNVTPYFLKKPILTYRTESIYNYYYWEDSATHEVFGDKYFDMLYFAERKKKLI